jgi:hypothetical protein
MTGRWIPPLIKKNKKKFLFFSDFFGLALALDKGRFADSFFCLCSLPSVALGKAFAECPIKDT